MAANTKFSYLCEDQLPHPMKYDIFISYRRAGGKHFARTLKETLAKKGYSVFLDLDELKDGHFMEAIYSAIDSSKVFFLVMSPDVFERCSEPEDHVRNEIKYALQRGMNIIPIVFDNQIPEFPENIPEDIKIGIKSIQYSFLDTEHFFSESVEKMVVGRVTPVLKSVRGTKTAHKYTACITSGIIVILAVVLLLSGHRRSPEAIIERADELAKVETEPRPLSQLKEEFGPLVYRHILNLYAKGAKGYEEDALEQLELYNQRHDHESIDNAQNFYHNAGYAYHCLENYPKAFENYSMSISCAKKAYSISNDIEDLSAAAYSLNNMSFCYFAYGDNEKSIQIIGEAIALFPDDLNLIDSKGELLFKMGYYSRALETWDEIVTKDPYYKQRYWVSSSMEKLSSVDNVAN